MQAFCWLVAVITLASVHNSQAAAQTAATDRPLADIRRLNPHLSPDNPRQLPMKLRSLARGEFAYFRGTADLFYAWCMEHCADWLARRHDDVLLHGDVHPGNFGAFEVIDTGEVQWRAGLVDLDEAFYGPFQLDLLRCLVSLRLAAAENEVALPDEAWSSLAREMTGAYRNAHRGEPAAAAERSPLTARLLRESAADVQNAGKYYRKLLKRKSNDTFERIVERRDRIAELIEPPAIDRRAAVADGLWQALERDSMALARQLGIANRAEFDAALADVGEYVRLDSAGSQGVEKYLAAFRPRAAAGNQPVVLQVKGQPAPAVLRSGLAARLAGAADAAALERVVGRDRGAFVADAVKCYAGGTPRWVGHATIRGRPFLIKPKGPGNDEWSPQDLNSSADLLDAAVAMADALGRAHRAAAPADRASGAEVKPSETDDLSRQLAARSRAAQVEFSRQYQAFAADDEVIALSARADAWIQSAGR